MSKGIGKGKGAPGAGAAFTAMHEVWSTYCSNVYGWAVGGEEEALSVTFKCRGPQDWIGVAKRVGDDGGPEVVFGTAFDFVSCIMAVNAAMQADRWRVDTPWQPGK